jgi:hypothetical protein
MIKVIPQAFMLPEGIFRTWGIVINGKPTRVYPTIEEVQAYVSTYLKIKEEKDGRKQ